MTTTPAIREVCGAAAAVVYLACLIGLVQSGVLHQAGGLVGMGMALEVYFFSRRTAIFLLAAYLTAIPVFQLPTAFAFGEGFGFLPSIAFAAGCLILTQLIHLLKVKLEKAEVSERNLRLIAENTHDLILAYDMQRRLTFVNPAVETLIGYSVAEMYARNFVNWLHPEDSERILALWSGVFEGKGYSDVEFRAITRDGRLKWFSSTHGPILDERGRQVGVQGVDREITARKLIEEALHRSSERLEGLINSIEGIVWEADPDTLRFLFVSRRAKDILGYPPSQWVEDPGFWAEHVHPEDRQWAIHFCVSSTREGRNHSFEYRMIAADGRVVWLRDMVTVHSDNGRVTRLYGVMVDVTTLKETESALRATRDEALLATQAKTRFLATMSHEIRTPMNGVIGMTGLLLDTPLTADQREMAETVIRSAEALLAIINDILDSSKIEAGRLELRTVDFDLRRMMEDVASLVGGLAARKQVRLSVHLDENVPETLRGDSGRLRQVLLNLAANAVKFTDRGEVAILCRREPGGESYFEVRDSGAGIEREVLPLLFQPFTQADMASTRRHGGTGLGLFVSRQIVEAMGGQIGVESEPGSGSTFWFRVPLHAVDSLLTALPERRRPLPPPRSDGVRVLLVEDNPINQRVAIQVLGKLGYNATLAVNGMEAIEEIRRSKYDLILMDCQMPEIDGFETTRRIRELEQGGKRTPVIAMTANAMVGDREECLRAGMDDYVSKPIDLYRLAEALEQWTPRSEVWAGDQNTSQGLRP